MTQKKYPDLHGAWRSTVAHHFGVVGVAGSNPVAPTKLKPAKNVFIKYN